MDITNVINKNLIKLDIKSSTREEAVEELINLLDKDNKIFDKDGIRKALEYRESLASTYCGFDMAIPHGISNSVKSPTLCFGRCNPFDWDDEGTTVRFIFMILVPEEIKDGEPKHLDILAKIAQLTLDDEIKGIWEVAKTEDEILDSIKSSIN